MLPMCVLRMCVQAGACKLVHAHPRSPEEAPNPRPTPWWELPLPMFSHEGRLQAFCFPIYKLNKGRASTFQEFARTKRQGSEVAGAAAERAEDGCVTTTSCCDGPVLAHQPRTDGQA